MRKTIGRISSDVLPGGASERGRKKQMTPTKMKNGINKYFAWCEEIQRVPSIKGMMIFMKLKPEAFKRYVSYPEFQDMMEQARLIIKEWCENDIYTTQGPTAGKIAYMKNVHDWVDKVETKTEVTQRISAEEARARIEMLAPKLLEILIQAGSLPANIAIPEPQKAVEAVYEEKTTNDTSLENEELVEPDLYPVDTTPRRVVR